MERQIDWTKTAGGGIALAFGLAFFAMSFGYGIGTPTRMEAGFFPMLAGALSAIAGLTLAVSGLKGVDSPERIIGFSPRALVCALLAVAAFALLIQFGLLMAVLASTAISAVGDPKNRVLEIACLAVGSVLLVWAVFVLALDLPLDMVREIF